MTEEFNARELRQVEPRVPDSRTDTSSRRRSRIKGALLLILAFTVPLYTVHIAIQYSAFAKQLEPVQGIRVGDSRDEVLYRLGWPGFVLGELEEDSFGGMSQRMYTVFGQEDDVNKMPPTTGVRDYKAWVYEGVPRSGVRLTITFDETASIESISLYTPDMDLWHEQHFPVGDKTGNLAKQGGSRGWGPVVGIRSGDSEEKVLALGAPSRQTLDGVSKTINYSDIGVEITLSKGHAYMISVKKPQSNAALFWRFLRGYNLRSWGTAI